MRYTEKRLDYMKRRTRRREKRERERVRRGRK